jgi:predicted transcriptional regulator
MGKQALNTYVEPEQKARLERIAKRRHVSQATLVREAIEEYVARHDQEGREPSVDDAWRGLLAGYYAGPGTRNDHDDIYADEET